MEPSNTNKANSAENPFEENNDALDHEEYFIESIKELSKKIANFEDKNSTLNVPQKYLLSGCKKLIVDLADYPLKLKDIQILIKGLSLIEKVEETEMYFFNCKLNDESFLKILNTLAKGSQATLVNLKLDLTENVLTAHSFARFFEALSCFDLIKKVTVDYSMNPMSKGGVSTTPIKFPRPKPSLKFLKVTLEDSNLPGNQVFQLFSLAAGSFPQLHTLVVALTSCPFVFSPEACQLLQNLPIKNLDLSLRQSSFGSISELFFLLPALGPSLRKVKIDLRETSNIDERMICQRLTTNKMDVEEDNSTSKQHTNKKIIDQEKDKNILNLEDDLDELDDLDLLGMESLGMGGLGFMGSHGKPKNNVQADKQLFMQLKKQTIDALRVHLKEWKIYSK